MEVLVIGLGRFGLSIAYGLTERGVSVTVVDIDEKKVKDALDYVENGYILDSEDEKSLKSISVEYFDKVVIGLGKSALNSSLLTALNLIELGVQDITAKASSSAHAKLLHNIGVKNVTQPEHDMGKKVATKLSGNCLIDYIELSSDVKLDNIYVNEKLKSLQNKTMHDINLRKKFNVNIVSIQREGEIIIPERDTVILENDILIIIGQKDNLATFEEYYKLN